MIVYYKHPITKKIKEVKRGYSWTTFFFGCFVALVRGDFKWFFISLITSIGLATALTACLPESTVNILALTCWTIWANFYNKVYENELINKGYTLMKDTEDEE